MTAHSYPPPMACRRNARLSLTSSKMGGKFDTTTVSHICIARCWLNSSCVASGSISGPCGTDGGGAHGSDRGASITSPNRNLVNVMSTPQNGKVRNAAKSAACLSSWNWKQTSKKIWISFQHTTLYTTVINEHSLPLWNHSHFAILQKTGFWNQAQDL